MATNLSQPRCVKCYICAIVLDHVIEGFACVIYINDNFHNWIFENCDQTIVKHIKYIMP